MNKNAKIKFFLKLIIMLLDNSKLHFKMHFV